MQIVHYDMGFYMLGNMTGSTSVHTHYEGHEIMFHVSTLLPFSDDPQQVYTGHVLNFGTG